jgi:hypothetical protein
MRLVRSLRFICLLLLSVALFGGEVGESACFVDDISNDYIQAPASPAHKFAAFASANVMSQSGATRGATFTEQLIRNLGVTPSIEWAFSASDLLRLLSVQRK